MKHIFTLNIVAYIVLIQWLNPRLSLQLQNTLLTHGATPTIAAMGNTGEKPIAKFDYTPLGTSGIVTFNDLSENNPTYWKWDFGNGLGSNKRNPETYYFSSGIHTIQLIVLNEFGSDTISMDILVNLEYPEPAFSYTIVEGTGLVHFKDESSNFPFDWTWVFGDGEESYLQNPTHQYKNSGTYDVLLSASNGKGNKWTIIPKTIKITIDGTKPIANFKYTLEQESGRVNFTDLSENEPTTWKWDFGDGNAGNEKNPSHSYKKQGDYEVQLITENKHGIDVIKLPVSVVFGKAPVSKFEYNNLAGSLEVNFTDNSENGPTNWLWDFGDGNSSTQQNPTYQYQNSGSYIVKLVAANNIGIGTSETEINLTVTDIKKLPDGASLLIFPNPFSEQLIFNISNMENEELLLKIFNISGQLIQSRQLNNKIEIETSQWSKGAYIYQLTNKKGEIIATGKLIK